ncbi:glycosyltransferase [Streptomyces sp900116325]|uniref:Glycosyltransferase n=1 Tax=Streptomyces sp. 900116325 TaxID=3154295 RepID=A0ABV2UI71_9ACTN
MVLPRGGAGTIAELTALGRAAVFVPLATSAGTEQVDNAEHLATNSAAVTLVGDA